MKKRFLALIPIAVALALIFFAQRPEPSGPTPVQEEPIIEEVEELGITITPASIEQGEPALISIEGVASIAEIKSLSWNGRELGLFMYKGKPSALIGLDLKMNPGSYPVKLALADGQTLDRSLAVGKRYIAEAPLGIPDKLGGNTPQAERELISNLANENTILASVTTSDAALWNGEFRIPVAEPAVVTDPYGYTRLTGASTISHKGTDFRAPTGTPVYAMNSGVVRIARQFTVYGNTVVIDHGLGLQTLYMHLSELEVKVGDIVEKGEVLGLSGNTGYAESPHLHLSVRIEGVSIDPMKFVELLSQDN